MGVSAGRGGPEGRGVKKECLVIKGGRGSVAGAPRLRGRWQAVVAGAVRIV